MKHRNSFCLIFPLICVLVVTPAVLSGCAVLLLGGGAAGGYAISKDSIEGVVDGRKDRIYKKALESVRSKGLVKTQNQELGEIEALVQESTVKVKIEQVTERSVKLRVSARKYKFPRIKIAQEVYTDIIKRVT